MIISHHRHLPTSPKSPPPPSDPPNLAEVSEPSPQSELAQMRGIYRDCHQAFLALKSQPRSPETRQRLAELAESNSKLWQFSALGRQRAEELGQSHPSAQEAQAQVKALSQSNDRLYRDYSAQDPEVAQLLGRPAPLALSTQLKPSPLLALTLAASDTRLPQSLRHLLQQELRHFSPGEIREGRRLTEQANQEVLAKNGLPPEHLQTLADSEQNTLGALQRGQEVDRPGVYVAISWLNYVPGLPARVLKAGNFALQAYNEAGLRGPDPEAQARPVGLQTPLLRQQQNWQLLKERHSGDWFGLWQRRDPQGQSLEAFPAVRHFQPEPEGIHHFNDVLTPEGPVRKDFGRYSRPLQDTPTQAIFLDNAFFVGGNVAHFEIGFRNGQEGSSLIGLYQQQPQGGAWQLSRLTQVYEARDDFPQPDQLPWQQPDSDWQGYSRVKNLDLVSDYGQPQPWLPLENLNPANKVLHLGNGLAASLPQEIGDQEPYLLAVEWHPEPGRIDRGLRQRDEYGQVYFELQQFRQSKSDEPAPFRLSPNPRR